MTTPWWAGHGEPDEKRDREAERRDDVADTRRQHADERNRASNQRDQASHERDRQAHKRDLAALPLYREMWDLLHAAAQRDEAATGRDQVTGRIGEDEPSRLVQQIGVDHATADADRQLADIDRTTLYRLITLLRAEREGASRDRHAAAEDRAATAADRQQAAVERAEEDMPLN